MENHNRRVRHPGWWGVFALALLLTIFCITPPLRAQETAQLSGTVTDPTGALILGAAVVLENAATHDKRETVANSAGTFTLPSLNPGTYIITVSMKGFESYRQLGIVLDAGDIRDLPHVVLQIGSADTTVTVESETQIIPLVSGERAAILNSNDIKRLTLGSRDLSELLAVLPGVTIAPNGTNNTTSYNFETVSTGQSAVGNGLVANGVPNKGGTSLLMDGVDIIDPGCDCNAIALVNPDMTAQVSVQTSNFGAQEPYGPVVVSSISKSGSDHLHGQGYFYARNNVLDANTWSNDNQGVSKGNAHYYYPGGSAGGPVPHTHDKLFWWGGFERLLQNSGNTSVLESFIPTADQMSGNFGATTANSTFCLAGSDINSSQTNGCNDLTGTVLPDGTTVGPGTANGSTIPAQFISPGAIALSKVWPTANANPATTPGNYNYYEPVLNIHDGWLYRARVDYNLSDATKFFISYQQGYDSELANGNGAHIYYTPGDAIPYPGGGLVSYTYTKAISGHFLHVFSPTLTDEFIVAWGYGNFPIKPANSSAATRSSIGYPYGTLFNTGSNVIPAYSTSGSFTFPDFSEGDILDTPQHYYLDRKEIPSYEDDLTKVWGKHTIKVGAFAETVANSQTASENPNGDFTSFGFGGTIPGNLLTGARVGSPNNPLANFLMGLSNGYTESASLPNADLAYQYYAAYIDDLWKVSKKFTLELGLRVDHFGHWYDQAQVGVATFIPQFAASDYASGIFNPGIRYHAIDPGIPDSGMPDRFAALDPRIGFSYDIFGNGQTLIRGGWGMYRFGDQNTYASAVATSDAVLNYTLPSNASVFESQVPSIAAPTAVCGPTTGPGSTPCINGSVTAVNPTDYQVPLTYSYNVTIDHQLPWKTLFEAAYVGNQSRNIPMYGEDISGGGFDDFDNVNKIPLGALFKPDPVTGLTAKNPEDVTSTCSGVCNATADYRPYGKEYGDNPVYVIDTAGYNNYNSLQLSAVKRGKTASFNINYTFSKTLSTDMSEDAFNLRRNYGVSSYSRTHVFNASGAYTLAKPYKGSERLIAGVANGWTFSTVTTLQSGGNLQAINNANFGLALQYLAPNGLPVTSSNPLPNGATGNSLSQATYYGTTDTVDITPDVTCNPTSGLANNQRIKYSCFTPPPVGAYGPKNYPYTMAPYFMSNISMFKSFPIVREESVEFRADAFNWINHPLPAYTGNQLSLYYQSVYGTSAFTPNTADYPSGNPNNFGVMNTKAGDPNERTIELSVKYLF